MLLCMWRGPMNKKYVGIVLGLMGSIWTIAWGVTAGFQRGYPDHTWAENNIYPWILSPLIISMLFFSSDKIYIIASLVISFITGSIGLGSYYLWCRGWPRATPRMIGTWDVIMAWLIGGCLFTAVMAYMFKVYRRYSCAGPATPNGRNRQNTEGGQTSG
jgi:hypothetical protein